jgi:hypothetical protein
MLQEGKVYTGIAFQRGLHPIEIGQEIHRAGGGMRKFYTSLDGFVIRTMAYTTARVWGFLYFYDWLNPDPRRSARPDWMIMAGLAGGFVAGVATNPIEMVFARQQVDELYPEAYRRNYKTFLHGLLRVMDEGVLMRGALANGLKYGALCASMTNVFDWIKENSYYHLGPSWINRLLATSGAVAVGVACSMPFDTVRVRMHTMRPLPNGVMPYKNSFDCALKMAWYEGNQRYHGNQHCFFTGGQAYSVRLFLIAYLSQFMLDYYHGGYNVSEFWQPARFNYQGGIDYDVHQPFTDAFNHFMVSNWASKDDTTFPFSNDGKTNVITV